MQIENMGAVDRSNLQVDLKEVLNILQSRSTEELENQPFEAVLKRPLVAEDIRALTHLPIEFSFSKLGDDMVLGTGEEGMSFRSTDMEYGVDRFYEGHRSAHTHPQKIGGLQNAPSPSDLFASFLRYASGFAGMPDVLFDTTGITVYQYAAEFPVEVKYPANDAYKRIHADGISDTEVQGFAKAYRKVIQDDPSYAKGETIFFQCKWEEIDKVALIMAYFNEEKSWTETYQTLKGMS